MREITIRNGPPAIVDDEHFDYLSRYSWFLHTNGYAVKGGNSSTGTPYMHRIVLGATAGEEVDHINGNKLDNRRANLRFATRSQNNANQPKRSIASTSAFKGVHWCTTRQHWIARISINGKMSYLGMFDAPEQAARAYDTAAREAFGAYAYTNFGGDQ